MCSKPTDIYRAVPQPMFKDCLLDGKFPDSDTLLNSEFESTLEGCMFKCSHMMTCKAFTYDTIGKKCFPKSSDSHDKFVTVTGMLSGPQKLCGEPKKLISFIQFGTKKIHCRSLDVDVQT